MEGILKKTARKYCSIAVLLVLLLNLFAGIPAAAAIELPDGVTASSLTMQDGESIIYGFKKANVTTDTNWQVVENPAGNEVIVEGTDRFWTNSGTMTMYFNVAQAGQYEISLGAAGQFESAPCSASVNGTEAAVPAIAKGTANQPNWSSAFGTFELEAGVNQITFTANNGTVRLSAIKLTPSDGEEISPSPAVSPEVLRMDVRTDDLGSTAGYGDYTLGTGVTVSQPQEGVSNTGWSGNTGMNNSQGQKRTIFTNNTAENAEWVQFNPNKTATPLKTGNYNVYFWYVQNSANPMNLSAEVSASGQKYQIEKSILTEAGGGSAKWVKVGTFAFNGNEDEYLKLISQGAKARVGDVKFEKTEDAAWTPTPAPSPLRMDVRSDDRTEENGDAFILSKGVTASENWSGNSGLSNSEGRPRTIYTTYIDQWVQFNPNQSGTVLAPGNYDVYLCKRYFTEPVGGNFGKRAKV